MWRPYCILFFLIYCFSIVGQSSLADQIAVVKSISGGRIEQIAALQLLLEDPRCQEYPDTLGLVYYAMAFRYKDLEMDSLVIQTGQKGIELLESVQFSGYQLPFLYSWIGEAYKYLGDLEKALTNYQVIINHEPQGRSYTVFGYAHLEIGRILNDYEDYDLSKRITDQFLESHHRNEVSDLHLCGILLTSSIAYSSFKDQSSIDLAKVRLKEARDTYVEAGIEHPIWEELEMQRAYVELISGNFEAASEINNNLFEKLSSSGDKWDIEIATDLAANTSFFYHEMGRFDKALEMGKKAQHLYESKGQSDQVETEYIINDNIAIAFLGIGELDSAMVYIEKGLALFNPNELEDSNRRLYLNLLYDKAAILIAKGQEVPHFLNEALDRFFELDSLFDIHIQEQLSEYSVVNLKALGVKYYRLAIDLAGRINDKEAFWYFSEKTKGLLLLRSHVARRQYEGLSVDQKELDQLRVQRIDLRAQLEVETNDSISSLLSQTNKKLINTLLSQSGGQNELPLPIAINEMQNTLISGQYLLQYQYGNEDLWLQLVSNKESKIYNLGAKVDINARIAILRGMISDAQSSITTINELASQIYQSLIEPIGVDEGELLIIPDQELFFLPFEVLRNQQGFLIRDVIISYLPSGTFLNIERNDQVTGEMVLCAPEYSQSDPIHGPLKYAKNEVDRIFELYNAGKVLTATDKSELIQAIRGSEIFHFSGHAIARSNTSRNYLSLGSGAGGSNKIELQEIQNLATQAKLITLSACDTGTGEVMDGEGASSLSRGFLSAGAQSVVNTLWEVDDQSTSKILIDFYTHLKDGQSKSKALQEAKLEYMNTSESFRRHPYYWAGIIGTGLMIEPISHPILWWRVLAFFLLLGLLLWFLTWRYSKNPFPKLVFLSDWSDLVGEEIPPRKRKK